MGGRGVEIVVQLLDVLAMVSLAVSKAEQPFLENRIATVPEGEREAHARLLVTQAGQAILAPTIGA